MMKQLNTPQKKWGCGTIVVVILMICGALYLLPQLFGGNGANTDTTNDTRDDNSGDNANNSADNIRLGSLVVSEEIDRDGCPTEDSSNLNNVESFYVVAPDSEFPSGTGIFARLYRDGEVIEDLPQITANQDYNSSCVSFLFETTNGNDFASGEYEVEFWVNGNSFNTVRFNID